MPLNADNEYYIVKGWFEEANGMHQGSFYGAVATPENLLSPRRVVVSGGEAEAASKAAAGQPARVYPEELFEAHDAGGLNPKERADTASMLLDGEVCPDCNGRGKMHGLHGPRRQRLICKTCGGSGKAKSAKNESLSTGAIAMKDFALGVQSPTNTSKYGMSDRGGHGRVDNLGPKRVGTGKNIKGKGKVGLKGFGDNRNMATISQSGGRKGGRQ